MPKIADISGPEWDRKPPGNPAVSIIVPACNEAADIEATLTRLLALEYDNYEVIAVDDRSTDQTGEIMERIAAAASPGRLKVIHIAELPAGWMGKPHAMWSAEQHGHRRLAAVHRCRRSVQAGLLCAAPWPMPNQNAPTTSSSFPA